MPKWQDAVRVMLVREHVELVGLVLIVIVVFVVVVVVIRVVVVVGVTMAPGLSLYHGGPHGPRATDGVENSMFALAEIFMTHR